MIRKPVVAGQFYPDDAKELKSQLNDLIEKDCEKGDVLGVVSPHAGYIYSGRVAGSLFSRINVPETVVILTPNHTGLGAPYSIWPDGYWETPLGKVKVDEDLVNELAASCRLLTMDYDAHISEHSGEVILPFLQYINPAIKIVVIVIWSAYLNELKELGESIAKVLGNSWPNALVVASSDMTHMESEESANLKDKTAIKEIIALNEDGLYKKVKDMHITMCGVYPTISMLACSKKRGAVSSHLVKYETSGKTSGDYSSVVGYAGVIVKR